MLNQFLPSVINSGKKSKTKMDSNLLNSLVNTISDGYHNVVYHCYAHAVDVAQMMYTMLTKYCTELKDKHKFYLILACLCHDLGHFGFGSGVLNSERFKSCSFSKQYGRNIAEDTKRTVIECFHVEKAIQILETHEFFKQEGLIEAIVPELRIWLSDLILATDLANQKYFLNCLSDPNGIRKEMSIKGIEAPSGLALLLIKLSDMGSVFRPFVCGSHWTTLVMEEGEACSIVKEFYEKNNETEIGDEKSLLASIITATPAARQHIREKTEKQLEERMRNFASGLVKPMVVAMQDIKPDLFKFLDKALNEATTPGEFELDLQFQLKAQIKAKKV